jgi:hypothetical protein
MARAAAVFDSLFIAQQIEEYAESPTMGEIHLFAYVACLLSMLRGSPSADWGYEFAATSDAAPVSTEITEAIGALVAAGWLERTERVMRITLRGRDEVALLRQLTQNHGRIECLGGSCATALALPLPVVRDAISIEPQVQTALSLDANRPLLTEATTPVLHDHFVALARATSDSEDLMVPAVLWLSYLATRPGDQETDDVDRV